MVRGSERLDQQTRDGARPTLVGRVPGIARGRHRRHRGAAREIAEKFAVRRRRVDRERKQREVVDAQRRACAQAAGVAGKGDMEVASAAVVGRGAEDGEAGMAVVVVVVVVVVGRGAVIGPAVGVALRFMARAVAGGVGVGVTVSVSVAVLVMALVMVVVRARRLVAAVRTRGDAQHAARRHAGEHLREQEQREQEACERVSHAGVMRGS